MQVENTHTEEDQGVDGRSGDRVGVGRGDWKGV